MAVEFALSVHVHGQGAEKTQMIFVWFLDFVREKTDHLRMSW